MACTVHEFSSHDHVHVVHFYTYTYSCQLQLYTLHVMLMEIHVHVPCTRSGCTIQLYQERTACDRERSTDQSLISQQFMRRIA